MRNGNGYGNGYVNDTGGTTPDPNDWFTQNAPPGGGGSAANQKLWDDSGHDPATFAAAFIAAHGLQANQLDHAALQQLVDAGNSVDPGKWAMDTPDAQGRLEGLIYNGTKQQLIGGNGWVPMAAWPAASGGGGFSLGGFTMGQFATPWSGSFPTFPTAQPYTPTTQADVLADPGYRFGADEGARQLQQGAAARGLLNTGGTAKDLYAWGNSYANSFLGNVDARRRADYATNYQTQTLDPYQNAYKNAMDSYNVWRQQQNDVWGRVFQAGTA